MTLSVCLIVKDEAKVISRCLSCVKKFADEIIIADTGSTDGTKEIAARYTDKIYDFAWNDDFSAARNFSLSKATCDFVMWLDADDVINDENCEKIRVLVNGAPDFDMAFLKYASDFDCGESAFTYYRERIFRRSKNFEFEGAVHEAVTPRGKIIYSDATVFHKKVKSGDKFRNLRIYQRLISEGKNLNPRERFYYGRELMFCGMYREAAAVLENFLYTDGWVVNKIEACLNLHSVYSALNEEEKALSSLFRSLQFGVPGSEFCCRLGAYFLNSKDYQTAAFWYKAALDSRSDGKEGGFVNLDSCGFIPNIQLCVIYDRLGETEVANGYNETAGKFKPHNESYIKNKEYFSKKLKEVKD